jgi:hypothetical protein
MLTRRLTALVTAAVLVGVGVARADGPPSPPRRASFAVLAPRETWTAPAEGGFCLEPAAWTYSVELRRYYEARIAAGEQVAESHGWTGAMVGFAAGVVVAGAVAAWVAR